MMSPIDYQTVLPGYKDYVDLSGCIPLFTLLYSYSIYYNLVVDFAADRNLRTTDRLNAPDTNDIQDLTRDSAYLIDSRDIRRGRPTSFESILANLERLRHAFVPFTCGSQLDDILGCECDTGAIPCPFDDQSRKAQRKKIRYRRRQERER